MNGRQFQVAMRLIDFVEKLCLTPAEGPSADVPEEQPKPAAATESQYIDADAEHALTDALNRIIGVAPDDPAPLNEVTE